MIIDTLSKVKRLFGERKFAYMRVFDKENQYTKTVLKDLAKFCRAHETTFNKDPYLHATIEGRREVWLRIQEYLELEVEEIYALHRAKEMVDKK